MWQDFHRLLYKNKSWFKSLPLVQNYLKTGAMRDKNYFLIIQNCVQVESYPVDNETFSDSPDHWAAHTLHVKNKGDD